MSRTQLGRTAPTLALLLVAVFAAIGAIAWLVVRENAQRERAAAQKPKGELPKESNTNVSADSTALEGRSAEKSERGAKTAASATEAGGTGTLRIHVLDEATHAPIAELGYIVFCERSGATRIAAGKTDAEGRALVRDVEANTILVRTERKAPHAEATGAVWLTAGATKEVEILVGAGSTISGRVVDDLKQPVAGAAISVNDDWASLDTREPEVRSGGDGRFRLEHVMSRPSGVWIVKDEMRPDRWEPARLFATFDGVTARKEADPVPGKDLDVGDIVLQRAAIFAGRVLDSHGRPVEGALVTGRHERDEARRKPQSERGALGRPPGDPEFHLYSREALTNGSGEFELHLDPGWLFVYVWTRADQMQRFWKVEIVGKPGERTDGIVLQLAGLTNVELELVDASGAPAQVPTAGFGSKARGLPWRSNLREKEIVAVEARAGDGTQGRGSCASRDPDGIWRMQVNLDPEAIEELEVTAAGYETIAERSTSGFPALVHRRLVLRELPSVRVRLAPKDPAAKVLEPPGVLVSLHACMADPARRAARGRDCCGFGSMWRDSWNGAPLSLVLPVGRKGAFWVYAYARDANEEYKTHEVAHFGPFEAGADEHDLVLDPADFVHVMPKDEVTRNPPEASAPGTEHSAIIRAHISDAKTGKGVPKVWVNLSEIAPAGRRSRSVQDFTDDNGDLVASSKPACRWTIFAGKNGYKRAELGERETRAGETLDLGTILLEPYSVHRGRLLDEDGKPLVTTWFCVVGTSGDLFAENGGGITDASGTFQLLGDLPAKFNVQASAKRTQRFLLDLWPEDEIKELRFVPSRRVVVTIVGAEAEESELTPYVCPAPGEPTATCDHRIPLTERHLELARGLALGSVPEGQRYAFLLAPGRYQIWGDNLMHEITWTEFEVAAGEGDIQLAVPTH